MSRSGALAPVTGAGDNHREEPSTPADTLWIVFDAAASVIAPVRRDIAAWLSQLQWPVDAAHDIVLAIHEALANVVDHAYPAEDRSANHQGRLYVWQVRDDHTQQRRVVASVIDRGRWKSPTTPAAGPRAAGEPSPRGRGLAVMAGCMRHVVVQPSVGGTTVILTSHHTPATTPPAQ